MTPRLNPSRWKNGLWALLLVALTVAAYRPAWHAGFIWDDDRYVTRNPLLTAPDGLQRIWFSTDSPSQYFPLVYTTFRFEHALWGLNPAGYHWVNLLLHAINALLVWRLLARLSIPGAWFAAAIFAVHPVNVESVAWITELKNVESLLFFLLALLAWVAFVERTCRAGSPSFAEATEGRPDPAVVATVSDENDAANSNHRPGTAGSGDPALQPSISFPPSLSPSLRNAALVLYALALFFYALALFSKTTACTLPAALLLVLWLKREPISWARIAQTIPFVALGLGMGLVSMWWERYHQGTAGKAFAFGFGERFLIASRAVWFYLGKLAWPTDLSFAYPQWKIHLANPRAYAWLLASVVAGAAIYSARRRLGRGPEVAAVYYVATLAPLLGFVMLWTFQYKFVADHYQYMASIGPIALVVAGLSAGRWLAWIPALVRVAFCGVVLTLLAGLTWRQCRMYANIETLWRTTLAKNPDSFLALNNLGEELLRQGRVGEATVYLQRTLDIKPDSAQAHCNLGVARLQHGQIDAAIREFETAAKLQPDLAEAYKNLSDVYILQGRMADALVASRRAVALDSNFAEAENNLGNALLNQGQVDEAIEHLKKALTLQPNFPNALNNLGVALIDKGKIPEATALFRRTVELLPEFAQAHHNLGRLELMQGHVREAMQRYELALKIQPDDPDTLSSLAWILATSPDSSIRDGSRAVVLAEHAAELSHRESPSILGTLAAAYAEAGRYDEAVRVAQRALQLAESQSNATLANLLRAQIELHRRNAPLRDQSPPAPNAPTTASNDRR